MNFIDGNTLHLSRCPYCNVHTPNIRSIDFFSTNNSSGSALYWVTFSCQTCGGVILVKTDAKHLRYTDVHPSPSDNLDNSIPERAAEYLLQAIESKSAPAGSIMLAASSIDAMLKTIGYKDGNLFERINKAATDHKLTADMAKWAHQIRLDANDQRHDDEQQPLPSPEDAQRSIEFALALAEFLFVLPSRVTRGIEESIT